MRLRIAKPLKCLVCGRTLGILRRRRSRFCSNAHEQEYLTQLREVAILRLQNAAARLEAIRAASSASQSWSGLDGGEGASGGSQESGGQGCEVLAGAHPA